jgi:CRISPR-associated protein Csh1
MDGLGLEGARRGLFLMGVLIGKIGSTPEQRESEKPILNKLIFQGMDRLKVIRLANEIYEKLRQYKIADKNEVTYAVAKAHLDSALNELDSPQENVFWILSGYSYATWKAIQAGKEKKEVQG